MLYNYYVFVSYTSTVFTYTINSLVAIRSFTHWVMRTCIVPKCALLKATVATGAQSDTINELLLRESQELS